MSNRWNQDKLLETARAYQSGCVLIAAAELEIFDVLRHDPRTAASIADKLNADPRATTILLDALAAMGLISKQNDQYQLTKEAAECLLSSSPKNILPAVRHTGNCMRRWSQLARVVKTGRPITDLESIRGKQADQAAFINAMHVFSDPQAEQIIDKLKPLNFEHLLDIGGASGTWTIEFLKHVPTATATLFDLPHVIPLAEDRFRKRGLNKRVKCSAGDFYTDDLPAGADLVWLSAIAHQNSRQQNRDLFKKIFDVLESPGALAIRDIVMDPTHTSPAAGAMFAVNVLTGTEAGGTWSFDQYRDDLAAARFTNIELVYQDEHMNSLIRAIKR